MSKNINLMARMAKLGLNAVSVAEKLQQTSKLQIDADEVAKIVTGVRKPNYDEFICLLDVLEYSIVENELYDATKYFARKGVQNDKTK